MKAIVLLKTFPKVFIQNLLLLSDSRKQIDATHGKIKHSQKRTHKFIHTTNKTTPFLPKSLFWIMT